MNQLDQHQFPVHSGQPAWIALLIVVAGIALVVYLARRRETRGWALLLGIAGPFLMMLLLYQVRHQAVQDVARPSIVEGIVRHDAVAPSPMPDPPSVIRATEPDIRLDDVEPQKELPANLPPEWTGLADGEQRATRWLNREARPGERQPHPSVVVAATGTNAERCWRDMCRNQLRAAIADYYRGYLEAHPGGIDGLTPEKMNSLVAERYTHHVERGEPWINNLGRRVKLFVRVDFTPEVREKLIAYRAESLIDYRLIFTAIGGAVLVMLVGIAFGYLKLSSAYEGANRAPLQFVLAVLVVVVVIGGMIAAGAYVETESWYGTL